MRGAATSGRGGSHGGTPVTLRWTDRDHRDPEHPFWDVLSLETNKFQSNKMNGGVMFIYWRVYLGSPANHGKCSGMYGCAMGVNYDNIILKREHSKKVK